MFCYQFVIKLGNNFITHYSRPSNTAKFRMIIRVKNFYALNCKKVPHRHLQGT